MPWGLPSRSAGRRASGRSWPPSWRWRRPRPRSPRVPACSRSIRSGSAFRSSSRRWRSSLSRHSCPAFAPTSARSRRPWAACSCSPALRSSPASSPTRVFGSWRLFRSSGGSGRAAAPAVKKKARPGCRGGPTRYDGASLVLEIRDLSVRPFLPGVEHVAVLLLAAYHVPVVGHIALLVESDVAQNGVERFSRMHDLGDLFRVERLGLLGSLLDDLNRGVAVKRIGLRLETALLAEEVDDFLVLRIGARIGRERHQRALGAGPGNGRELVVGDAVTAHQRHFQALIPHLAEDQAAGVMQTAPIDQIRSGGLQLGDKSSEILVVLVDPFIHDLLHALGVHGLPGLVGKSLTIRGLVVDYGHAFALEPGGDDAAGDAALLIVAAAHAEHVPHRALGDLGICGGGRDDEDAVFLVHLRGRYRDAGIEVSDHELYAVASQLVGN